jgi:arabinogalactan oligomer/maltooligosaccharide transport system substrate-binding protein
MKITPLLVFLLLLVVPSVYGQKQITVWHAYRGAEKAAFEKVVGQFNEKMKDQGVSAKTLAVPYDAMADKITAAVPRGKGPDVFIFAQDRLGGWIEAANTVEPLDFFLEDEVKKRFLPLTMEAMTYKDTVYGLPFNFKMVAMIYNKALVPNPPKTSSELVALAKSMTDQASGKFGLAYSYSDFYYHSALMNAFGGRVFEAGPKAVLNHPNNIKSLEYLMKWFKTDGILPADPSSALINSLFNSGKAAIVFSGPWFIGEIDASIQFGVAPLPIIEEAQNQPMSPWVTVEGIYVALPSQHKEEAYAFVDFATSFEGAKIMTLEGNQLAANQSVYELKEVQDNEILKAFRQQLNTATPMPNYAEMTMMWSPVTTAMNTIVRGAATASAAMDKAQVTIEESMQNLRKGN